MRLHLLGIKGLNLLDHRFHFINHFLTIRTAFWQKVDHPHGARFTPVQIRQSLGRRARVIPPPLLVVVEGAEMHSIGWRGRRMSHRQRRENKAE